MYKTTSPFSGKSKLERIRRSIRMERPLFARLIGISDKTLQEVERGARPERQVHVYAALFVVGHIFGVRWMKTLADEMKVRIG